MAGVDLHPGVRIPDADLDCTVLICTYNRARLLAETLDILARTCTRRRWEVIVVDNNSRDETRPVVESRVAGYPAPLRYLFEPRQGKSHALNTGIAASHGRVIAFTDDDVQVEPQWVDAACDPIEDGQPYEYAGGPVHPIWGAPPPDWLDRERPDIWGTIAILDYGPQPFVFEERKRVPIGANMAVRRALVERIGGFNPELGRRGDSLLGQEQAELLSRSRAAGATGVYAPAMAVHHHVPAQRLTRQYFRRWWFWKGISRARLDRMHATTELGLDLRRVPHLLGAPRFMYSTAVREALAALRAWRSKAERFRHQMMVCYCAGYVWDRRPRTPASR